MAPRTDLTWVDPELQDDIMKVGNYIAPKDIPLCGHPRLLVGVQGEQERLTHGWTRTLHRSFAGAGVAASRLYEGARAGRATFPGQNLISSPTTTS